MADISVKVNGMTFPNPFVLGSGPPGTNAKVINRSFDLGWGGIVCKTVSLDNSKVHNTVPRYARLKSRTDKTVIGFENIELISDRPFEAWLDDLASCKQKHPDKILIASVMEEYNKDAWCEIIERTQETGVDAFELNFSCPHGLPERKMGMAMGENPDIVGEVTGWCMEVSKIPVWAKMTPNITNITVPARAALDAGAHGISAINTILSVCGINLKTLRPMPTVEGYTVPGGYSGQAVKPIALRHVMELARMFPDVPVSGMGGVETAADAAEFILLGSSTVQVCTGAMLRGYELIEELCTGLSDFLDKHDFSSVEDCIGHSLPYFTTHADLVDRQRTAKRANAGRANRDNMWKGNIAAETKQLAADE
ncbi:MAG: NAD-dependent dihydropyrimidine dehydrogenase subunit PreA [Myxococcales bacterium]|nr:NAD-dependent dihydropyrimidine dehydrogenase subunit PreA [Myxococcales bacterium]